MRWGWVIIIGIAIGMIAMWLFEVARRRDEPMTHMPWGTPMEEYRDSLDQVQKKLKRQIEEENQKFLEEQKRRIEAARRFDALVEQNQQIQHQHEVINDRVRAMSNSDRARYFAEQKYK